MPPSPPPAPAPAARALQLEASAVRALCPRLGPSMCPRGYDGSDLQELAARTVGGALPEKAGAAHAKAAKCAACGAADDVRVQLEWVPQFATMELMLASTRALCKDCRRIRDTGAMVALAAEAHAELPGAEEAFAHAAKHFQRVNGRKDGNGAAAVAALRCALARAEAVRVAAGAASSPWRPEADVRRHAGKRARAFLESLVASASTPASTAATPGKKKRAKTVRFQD